MLVVLFQVVTVAALLWSLYNLYRVLTRRPATPTHAPSTTTRTPLNSTLKSGAAAHDARAAAPTAKLSMVDAAIARSEQPTEDDDTVQGLFNGTGKSAASADPIAEAARKASRQEQLGFHHSIPAGSKPGTDALVAKDTSATDALAAKLAQTGAAKGQDLSSILERIDLFLADDENKAAGQPGTDKVGEAKTDLLPAQDAPSNVSGALVPQKSASDAAPSATPSWARPDAVDRDVSKDDDGEQQRLF